MTNNDAIRVRDAGPGDLETIVRFNIELASESEQLSLDHDTVVLGVKDGLSDPHKCRYFVAEVDGKIAGQTMITLEWSDWRNRWFWWIQSVYVESEYRRRGIFRALHEHIRTLAQNEKNVRGLRLYVYNKNVQAIQTYKDLGMTVTGYHLCEEEW